MGRVAWSSCVLLAMSACSFEGGRYQGTSFRCGDGHGCPGDAVCLEGRCVAPEDVPPDASPEPDGLIHHWTLDEGDGVDVADSVAGADGVVVGGGTWVEGRHGAALACDGDDDWVEIGPSVPIELGTEFTIALWARPASETTDQDGLIFVEHATTATVELDGNSAYAIAYHAYSGDWPGYVVYGDETLAAGTWSHVVFRVQDTEMRLYIDGVLDAVATSGTPVTDNGAVAARLCARHPDNQTFPFAGAIDDVRIYDRALESDEIERMAQPAP